MSVVKGVMEIRSMAELLDRHGARWRGDGDCSVSEDGRASDCLGDGLDVSRLVVVVGYRGAVGEGPVRGVVGHEGFFVCVADIGDFFVFLVFGSVEEDGVVGCGEECGSWGYRGW